MTVITRCTNGVELAMTTHENLTADIKQILEVFDKFINMVELENWLKNTTLEEIKNSFKLTAFIEENIKNLQKKQCVDLFRDILICWWKTKNRTKVYDIQFFTVASDHLLSKFFTNNFVAIVSVDIAVRVYTTLYSKDRFDNFLSSLISNSASYEAIVDYSIANKNCIDIRDLECRLLLRNWSVEIECGRLSDVKAVIVNMLSNYKVKSCLSIIMQILTLKNVLNQEIEVKKLIMKCLHLKMVDRSILSRHLWLNIFKNVNRKHLSEICEEYPDFLKEFFNFVIYVGCMMNSALNDDWIGDPSVSICPDVMYNDLVDLVKCLCDYNAKFKKYCELRISQAKNSTNSQLWRQLEKDI